MTATVAQVMVLKWPRLGDSEVYGTRRPRSAWHTPKYPLQGNRTQAQPKVPSVVNLRGGRATALLTWIVDLALAAACAGVMVPAP